MTAGPNNGPICASAALADGGRGARFVIELKGKSMPAFAVRFCGKVYAYVNQCAHQSLELDWSKGNFFDVSGDFLMCATHGARYYPDTGACAGGRCDGQPLISLGVLERDDQVYLAVDGARLITGLDGS